MRVIRWLPLLCCVGLSGLMPCIPATPPAALLHGIVRDEHGPVTGALVRLKGTTVSMLTGADGSFELPSTAGTQRLTATKAGYVIAGAAVEEQPLVLSLRRVPTEDCQTYGWVDPTPGAVDHSCGSCHADIYRAWASSAHARSATGKHFSSFYSGTDWNGKPGVGWGLLSDHPDGAGVCSACHAPTVEPHDAAFYDLRQVRGVDQHGVHCDFCHKIADAPSKPSGLTHGRFALSLRRPKTGQLFFGQLDDVDRDEDVAAVLYRDSRYCASCHEGTVFGVHAYGTYSEWLDSPAQRQGRQCQSCHMAPDGELNNIAPGHDGIERDPGTLSSHRFVVGSLAEMLRRCLHVSVEIIDDGVGIRSVIRVLADDVGHRVPTGFVDRSLVLVVAATDSDGGQLVLQSEPRLPQHAGKSVARQTGRLFALQLADESGQRPVPFWRAAGKALDTRLFPGIADVSTYQVPASAVRLHVRLLYHRFWPDAAAEKGVPDNEIVVVDRTIDLALRQR